MVQEKGDNCNIFEQTGGIGTQGTMRDIGVS